MAAPSPLSAAASSCAGSSSNPTEGMVVLRSSGEGRCTTSPGDDGDSGSDRAVGGSVGSAGSHAPLVLEPPAVLEAGASEPLLLAGAESVEAADAVGV